MYFFAVLVKENERCEVIGFIKKGQCLLRRLITVAHTHPNGKKVSLKINYSINLGGMSLFTLCVCVDCLDCV